MPQVILHYLNNQFENATVGSRKRMNILLTDHKAKLDARASEHLNINTLVAPTHAVLTLWASRYTDWRNKAAAYRSASQAMQDLLNLLKLAPGPGQRSRIDEWESKIAALYAAGSAEYVGLLPQGRVPFTTGGRDNIIKEVHDLSLRLGAALGPLISTRDALQAQVDAITGTGGTPPQSLLDELETAKDRVDTITSLQTKTAAYHAQMAAARTFQQGKEGLVDAAATLVGEQRIVAARRLYANLALLMAHYVLLPGENPDPQHAAGDFFDLDTLIQTAPEEEEEEPPVPPTP